MAGIAFDGSKTTGHETAEPTTIISSKQNSVFVNNKKVLVNGDKIVPHNYVDDPPHNGEVVAETTTIFINGIPVAKIGDRISCGDMISEASDNVFLND